MQTNFLVNPTLILKLGVAKATPIFLRIGLA